MKEQTAKSGLSPTRREFLQGVGGITLTISASGLITACTPQEAEQQMAARPANEAVDPNIWVTIGADDVITIQCPATEMGQGSLTALPLVLAEELDADWDKVRVETVTIHDTAFGNPFFANLLYTAGSATISGYYDIVRRAAVQARKFLVAAAAEHWGVPAAELRTEPSVVMHPASGRSLSYGEIAAFAALPESLPEVDESEFKPASEHRYLGKDMPRIDMVEKSTGTAEYGIDVQVPDMVYASVLRSPVEGEAPTAVDDGATRQMAGVLEVISMPWGVAVVGETFEAAKWGKEALNVTWSESSRFRNAELPGDLDGYLSQAEDLTKTGTPWHEQGDVGGAFEGAAEIIEASYLTDAAYHAQMEPMNATVSVSADGKSAEIWVSTQTQSLSILGAAEFLETTPENITLHPMYIGGAYGRRTLRRQKYVEDALFVSREIGRPVKVIWTREDDVKDGAFRPAAAQRLRAAFDADGQLTAWHHRVATPTVLEFMNPPRWEAAQGKDVISMLGSENARYAIPNMLAEHILTERCSRVAPWRGVATSYTRFAAESFVDELAVVRGTDPMQFRKDLCSHDPRALAVLGAIEEMSDWSRPRDGTALGVALAGHHDSRSGGVAEVSVDRQTGVVTVQNFWLAADPGYVVQPHNTEAQLDGNVIFGISNALKEQITIKGGTVEQSNFYDYPVMRMNEMPNVEVRAISTDNPPTGIGEIGLASTGAAIANAVFAATGARVRHMPLTPDRVLAALESA